MAPEKPLEFSDHARLSIASRGLTEAHVRYCRENDTNGHTTGDSVVWACGLPDSRRIKVKAVEKEQTFLVIYAFTY